MAWLELHARGGRPAGCRKAGLQAAGLGAAFVRSDYWEQLQILFPSNSLRGLDLPVRSQ